MRLSMWLPAVPHSQNRQGSEKTIVSRHRLSKLTESVNEYSMRKKVGSRSISRVLSWTAIHLGALLPVRSSSLPGSDASHA